MSEDAQIIEGDLQNVELPQVLQKLSIQEATGILTVQGDEDIVAVSCLNGQVVTADALNQTLEEGLGQVLASKNLVSKENFAAVAKEHQASGGSIGELLVSHGLLTRERLLEAMRYQTYRLMLQVLTWRKGEFKFYGGDEVSYEKGIPPISVDELLIRAVAELGEKSGLPGQVPKLDAVYRQVPPSGPVQILGRDGDGSTDGIWLTDLQANFLQRLDGNASALQVAKSLNTGRYKALFSLYQLLRFDLIQFVGASDPAVPAARAQPPAAPPAARPQPPPDARSGSHVSMTGMPGQSLAAGRGARPAAEKPAPRPKTMPRVAGTPGATLPRPWLGSLLATSLFFILLAVLLMRPGSIQAPFPWLGTEAVEQQIERSLFQKADRAATTFFLMESDFPNRLDELVDQGLFAVTDLRHPSGYTMRYTKGELIYQIAVSDDGQVIEGRSVRHAVAGDFILDENFVSLEEIKNPLVLLD